MFQKVIGFVIMCAVLALAIPCVAHAQEKSPAAATTGSSATTGGNTDKKTAPVSQKKRRGAKAPPKVEELEALVIEGRIQKPEVFYVITKAETKYTGMKLRTSFVHKIVDSVRENPF